MEPEEAPKRSRAITIEDLKSENGISFFVEKIKENMITEFEPSAYVSLITQTAYEFCQNIKPNLPAPYVLHRIQKMPKKGEIFTEVSRCVRKYYNIDSISEDQYKYMDNFDDPQQQDVYEDSLNSLNSNQEEPPQKQDIQSDDDICLSNFFTL
ncbi:hypothetical protein SS50377_24120 [Spironucleus salmonicida]|uniref:Uncharacterized protein n=1 Tax=Spironucleus salmonicida TaxID=348837 RepID=V6LHP9_9EUKA|nr:hypothetical protein SS50377_24120 [Spironucleus salmonicida]|eukprot:EST44100.1 Hypothetical protein SS50377_16099 [Spironucleus salmonicida]